MVLLAAVACGAPTFAAESEAGFIPLMDGKTFNGWKMATEHTNTWSIKDGAFVAQGDRCHLFYVGNQGPFKDFELKVDVMTQTNSNGGIYFHTKYQPESWPKAGFECQVNNSHGDWKKTGSIYDIANVNHVYTQDNKWWTQHIIVKGSQVRVLVTTEKEVNGKMMTEEKLVIEYNEPPGAQPGKDFERKLGEGTFALQAHDPKSIVQYKNIRVKKL